MHNSAITNNSRVPQLSTPLEDLKTIFQSKFTSKYILSMALYWHVSLFFLAMTTISKMVSSVWTELKLLSCTAIHTIELPLILHSESAKLWSFYMFPNYNCVDQNEWIWNLIKKISPVVLWKGATVSTLGADLEGWCRGYAGVLGEVWLKPSSS